ncbi:MAG TPA: flagellar type III secretion system protein FlhB [Xanthobacteraceae bacterium]|jgi:flagellar biosynthetic protein FlhB|nr:flagellar type III secretion system protein FlhB [Xanthobacteraceae bacterium]
MAEERDDTEHTEDPTPRRLEEAIQRGDVVKSNEVSTWFAIGGGTLVLMVFAGPMAANLETTFRGLLMHSGDIPTDALALDGLATMLATRVLAALGVPVLVLTLAALLGNAIQHRILFSIDPILPQLSRISPGTGLRRLFSRQALANFAKGLAKLALFGTVIGALLWPQRQRIMGLIAVDPAMILPFTQTLALKMLGTVVAILGMVAAADYLFQYRQWYDRHKMSVREMKEEFRQTEGDPAIKGKIRQLRAARARKRMMAKVPKASVVVTNPTHFAVALQYERGMNAPVCVAKGADLIARKIREVAEAHDIPVVENPPLARALHGTVEIDQEIPQEHYRAVAEIIGYVMRLRRAVPRPA